MAQAPLSKCTYAGCRKLTRNGRCERHKRERPQRQRPERQSKHHHLYNYKWELLSEHYREMNPLCVECLFRNEIQAAECVDHIAPHRGRTGVFWEQDNLCSLCFYHHNRKTAEERTVPLWEPEEGRFVVCGLPATGKTTRAKELATEYGCTFWDWDIVADETGFDLSRPFSDTELREMRDNRARWLAKHTRGPAVMIVSRPLTAMKIAANMRAGVVHMVCSESERQRRIENRMKAVDRWRLSNFHAQDPCKEIRQAD